MLHSLTKAIQAIVIIVVVEEFKKAVLSANTLQYAPCRRFR